MWFRKILHTDDDHVLMLSRVVLGIIFLAHGGQKVFGWFGGPGFDQTMKAFVEGMGIPAFFAALAILAEFLGGIGLLVGLLSRVVADNNSANRTDESQPANAVKDPGPKGQFADQDKDKVKK